MKKVLIFLFTLFLLVSCSSTPKVNTWSWSVLKKDFVIDTKDFWSLSFSWEIEKIWKVTSDQEIKLTSQAMWRIGSIVVKEGDKVKSGQILVSLQDTVWSYSINLERAKNMLEKMQINYDSTKINLDKQVFDSQIALDRINSNLVTAQKNTGIDIVQAQNDVKNANYASLDSKSALDVAKLDNSIAKAELDYNNVLANNKETIQGFEENFRKEYTNIDGLITDVYQFGDKLFDFSKNYEDQVKVFQDFLGANDIISRDEVKLLLSQLHDYQINTLNKIDITGVDELSIPSNIVKLQDWYSKVDIILDKLQKVLASSILSAGQLSQSQVDGYMATVNGYQSSYSINNNSFTAFKNATSSFLRTYKNSQISLAKQLDLVKKDKDIFLKSLDIASSKTQSGYDKLVSSTQDSINSLQLQQKSATQNLEDAKKTREVTLRLLDNSIQDAQIWYDSAAKEYSKLTIKSPIAGIVWAIVVDKWQDVANGTPVLALLWDQKSEIEIGLKSDELSYISVWNKVTFDLDSKPMIGSIYSITKNTDNNFNYNAKVVFDTKLDIIWGVVNVKIPIKARHPLIPLSTVKVIGTDKGIISLYKDGKIFVKEITLWTIYGGNVEYIWNTDGSKLEKTDVVILNDVSNYDENSFTIKLSN